MTGAADACYREARAAWKAGLAPVPCTTDGQKRPVSAWKTFERTRPTADQLREWYPGRETLGIVCGAKPDDPDATIAALLGIECLDFDDRDTYDAVKADAAHVGLADTIARIEHGYCDDTPGGGVRWLYRCPEVPGNRKLAQQLDAHGRPQVLVETRGTGGYCIVAPTSGKAHATGNPYVRRSGGFASITTVTADEHTALMALLMSFDRIVKAAPTSSSSSTSSDGTRPGDAFNASTTWPAILEPHGWRALYTRRDGVTCWQRPGKTSPGLSATTGHGGADLLYVFTASSVFDSGRSYDRFGAFAVLEHGGDFGAAVRALAARGLGTPTRPVAPTPAVQDAPATSHDLVVLRASDITPEAVTWMWDGRVAIGTTTMVAGNPGLGKSQLGCFLAAAVTTGGTMPDGSRVPLGDVLYLTAEDHFANTVVPRLMAAGADLSRVHFIDCVRMAAMDGQTRERGFDLVRDVPALDALLYQLTDVRLVIIDPVTAYLGATDSHRTSDVRGVLRPLERVAQAHHVAVVLVSHLNKGGGAEAMTRVTGSLAFVAAARSAFLVVRDPQDEDRRLLLCVKQNLAAEPDGMAFTVEGVTVEGQHGPIPTSRIVFSTDVVTVTADEALAAQSQGRDGGSETDEARAWLLDALADGARPKQELERQAKEDGLAWRTVQRGAKVLGVQSSRAGFGLPAIWTLPAPVAPSAPQSRHVSGLAQLDDLGATGVSGPRESARPPIKAVPRHGGESPAAQPTADDVDGGPDALAV